MKTWIWNGDSIDEFYVLYSNGERTFYVYNSYKNNDDVWVVKSSRKLTTPVTIENIYNCHLRCCTDLTKFNHEVRGGIEQVVVDVANSSSGILCPSLSPHGDDGLSIDQFLHDWMFKYSEKDKDNVYHWIADHNYVTDLAKLKGGL